MVSIDLPPARIDARFQVLHAFVHELDQLDFAEDDSGAGRLRNKSVRVGPSGDRSGARHSASSVRSDQRVRCAAAVRLQLQRDAVTDFALAAFGQ